MVLCTVNKKMNKSCFQETSSSQELQDFLLDIRMVKEFLGLGPSSANEETFVIMVFIDKDSEWS